MVKLIKSNQINQNPILTLSLKGMMKGISFSLTHKAFLCVCFYNILGKLHGCNIYGFYISGPLNTCKMSF